MALPGFLAIPGAMGAVGSIGSAILGGIGSLLGGNDTNETNLQIAREQNELAYKMFQEGNQFNKEQAIRMFNMENTYNSPIEQMKRFKAAGLNPFVQFGNGTAQAQSSPGDAATPSSVGVPGLTAPTMQNPWQGFTSGFKDIAQALGELADAKKAGFDVRRGQQLLDHEIQMYQLNENAQRMANEITDRYGYGKASQELAAATVQVSKIWADYDLAIKNGEYTDALRDKTLEEAKRIIEETNLRKKEALFLEKQILWYDRRATAEINEANSRAAANYSSVELNQASAEEKRQLVGQLNILNKYLDKKQQRELKYMSLDKQMEVLDGMVKNGFLTISGSASNAAGGNFGLSGGKGNGKGGGLNLGLGLDKSSSVSGSRSENVYRQQVQKEYERILDEVKSGDTEYNYQNNRK